MSRPPLTRTGSGLTVGVLALQGAFIEHREMVEGLGAASFEIRRPGDLDRGMDGLILPGGESTVMGRLLNRLDLYSPLLERIASGLPVFGTCAGLLLLAREVRGGSPCFGTMDILAVRNAYGRQLGSFSARGEMSGLGQVPMQFIRAPYIGRIGPGVEALARVDGEIVAARQDNMLVTAFHPELTGDPSVHSFFLSMARAAGQGATA